MPDLLLHETTDYHTKAVLQSPPHAILVSGPIGAGKETLSLYIAAKLLDTPEINKHPYFLRVVPEKPNLSINDIRKLRDFLSKKTTGSAAIRRIVFIADAHTMTSDAQNALLKTLEEPPMDTVLILTTSDITMLMPTIRSRAQQLHVLPVTAEQAELYFTNHGFTASQIQKAFFVSGGQAGLLAALLQHQTDHSLVQAINEAKQLLTATKYERLRRVEEFSKDKVRLDTLLNGLSRVVISGLRQATTTSNHSQTKRFYDLSVAIMVANEQLKKNVNPKLLLTNLFLEI